MIMKKDSHTHSLLQTWYMVAKSSPCHTRDTAMSLVRSSHWQREQETISDCLKVFTKQWRKEYLLGLREYHRNRTGAIEQSIRVADNVFLKVEGSARCWWKLAKVTELLKSRDNVARSAKIQVLNTDAQRRPTVLRRAVQHLIPLEVNHSLEMLKKVDYLRSLLFKYI